MSGNGNLGPRLERYVTDLVEKGRFTSRNEVLQEGVRLVEERENRLVALDQAISRGLADAAAHRIAPIDEVERALMARYQTEAKASDP